MNLSEPGLLIDDDELYLRTLQRSLARQGLETRTAASIAEALRVAETSGLPSRWWTCGWARKTPA